MALLTSVELVEEFYEEIKKDYPDLSLDQITEICYSPWFFLKNEMENGLLPEIRFKYFGVFKVQPTRAKFMLHQAEKSFLKGNIDERRIKYLREMINNFIKRQNEI